MRTLFSTRIRKALYGIMVLVFFSSNFGVGKPLVVHAQNFSEQLTPPQCAGAQFVIPSFGELGWTYNEPNAGEPGYSTDHTGIDILGNIGDPIFAAYEGVVFSKTDHSVTIYHSDLGIWTYYSHMDDVIVDSGSDVSTRMLIGHKGNYGTSIIHLHFSVKIHNADERYIANTTDPSPYFDANVNHNTGSVAFTKDTIGWCRSVRQVKYIDNPWPWSWKYQIGSDNNKIKKTIIDDQLFYELPGCSWGTKWLTPGSHTLEYWVEPNGYNTPTPEVQPWPYIKVDCAADDGGNPDGSPGSNVDNASLISHLTLPDGYIVSPGQSYTKTWRVKNVGTSTWTGYSLKFNGGQQMGGPSESAIPTTAPGATVDVSINIVAISEEGIHNGSWQIVNQTGGWVQGGQLPISIETKSSSTGSGMITMFDVSPASPSSASTVHIVGRVKYSSDFRSMRFVMGNEVHEKTNFVQVGDQNEISYDWDTSGLARGNYAIVFEWAKTGDLDWTSTEKQVKNYNLVGTPSSSNHAPDRPILSSPYNWYLQDASGSSASVTLCVNPVSDPDGNAVHYWFDVMDQGGGVAYNSGWLSNSCWTNTFAPNTYSWHAKAGDGTANSDWSNDTWNFSVAKGGVYLHGINFYNQNTNDTHVCVSVTYDGTIGPDVYAWLNQAPDGSDTGTWRLLDHYGPNTTPDCTSSDLHGFWIRSPEYTTGTHLLKVTASKRDSGSSATETSTYTIAYIRPPAPQMIAPSTPTNNGTWWNTRTIHFAWSPALRTTNYTLRASTNSNPWSDPSPVLNQVLGSDVTSYDYTFSQDYAQLYWSVQASNSASSADSGNGTWFGTDLVNPTCQVQTLQTSTYENVFQVNWSGLDNSSGMHSFNIQSQDSQRGTWEDWLVGIPAAKVYDLFTGQPGHTYSFRCLATDNATNTGSYPSIANTRILVDPASRPPTPWWNSAYSNKRNLTILNNMPGISLPTSYPVHLHFDSSTTPTASELYAASKSTPKCNDLRIVYNDTTELNRLVENCTSNLIDIWFRTGTSVSAGSSNNASHQLYYGNPAATNPPHDRNQVLYPAIDSNSRRVFDMREGTGFTLHDATGNGDATMGSALGWSPSGKFGPAVVFPGDQGPEPRPAVSGGYGAQPNCSLTVEFWMKRSPDHRYGYVLVQQEIGWSNPSRWIVNIDGGHLRFGAADRSGILQSNRSVDDETFFTDWHHIAVTYSCGGEGRMYIDGRLDTTATFSPGGLNNVAAPLQIGNTIYQTNRFGGMMSGFALSDGVRPDLSYGQFADITTEPSLAAGALVSPPISGSPDLAVLSLATYPNPGGGVLVEAQVQNQGNLDTQSGFYTDLYASHVPTGPNDLAGSLRFWVNDPIVAGATVNLTTVISNPSILSGLSLKSLAPGSEISDTLYAQTDSAGVVHETDKNNNIYSAGTTICLATADAYGADDTRAAASMIGISHTQSHNFDKMGDQDWIKFTAQAGKTYILSTSNLGASTDTYLYLYDTDGTTLLASNDDFGGILASSIEWMAVSSGTYYVLVKDWNPSIGGCGTSYNFSIIGDNPNYSIFLPLLRR